MIIQHRVLVRLRQSMFRRSAIGTSVDIAIYGAMIKIAIVFLMLVITAINQSVQNCFQAATVAQLRSRTAIAGRGALTTLDHITSRLFSGVIIHVLTT